MTHWYYPKKSHSICFRDPVERIEILHNSDVVWQAPVDPKEGNVDAHLLKWKTLNESQAESLRVSETKI